MRTAITALAAAGALALGGGVAAANIGGPAALAPGAGTTATVPQSHAQQVPRTHPNTPKSRAQVLLAGKRIGVVTPDGRRIG